MYAIIHSYSSTWYNILICKALTLVWVEAIWWWSLRVAIGTLSFQRSLSLFYTTEKPLLSLLCYKEYFPHFHDLNCLNNLFCVFSFNFSDIFPVNFEGAKLIINKALSSHFQINHTMIMSSLQPSGYRFGCTYVGSQQFSQTEASILGVLGLAMLMEFFHLLHKDGILHVWCLSHCKKTL